MSQEEISHAGIPASRQVFELTVLKRVGVICSAAKNITELLTGITDLIARELNPSECGFLLLDRDRGVLVPFTAYRSSIYNDSKETPPSSGLTAKTVQSGQPCRVGDLRIEPDHLDLESPTRSVLCLTLRVGVEIFGVFNIESSQVDAFSEADERLMIEVLDLVGVTLERLHQIERLQTSETRLQRMLDNLPVGVLVHDGQRIYYVNPKAQLILGADDVERLYQMSPLEIMAPDCQELVAQRTRSVLEQKGQLPSIEVQVCRPNGTVIDIEVNCHWTVYSGRDCVQTHFTDISERKQAERNLRFSEQRFRLFMQHLPGLAWIKDVEGRYVYANETALKVFRTSAAELVGKTDQDLFSPETAAQFQSADRQALAEGKEVQTVETLEHADGVLHHSLVSKFPLLGTDGKFSHVGGIALDITERNQAEQALLQSEQRFRELADAIPQIIWIAEADGGLIHLNAKATEYTGIEMDDLTGWSWDKAIHPEDLPATVAVWTECLQDGNPRDISLRIRRGDSTYRWHVTRQVPIRDSSGAITTGYGTCTDIDDFKQVQASLQENETRFRLLFEGAADAIFWADADSGLITHCNHAAESLLGRNRSEIIGQPQSFLHPPEEAERYRQLFQDHLREQPKTPVEVEVIHKDGHRIDVAISPSVTVIGGHHVIQGIFRDITERKQAERIIAKLSTFRETLIRTAAEGICVCFGVTEFPFVTFSVWNDRMTEITGYTLEEINRLGWYQSLYPDPEVQQRAQQRMDRMRDGDDLHAEEWEITRKDGQVRTVSISTSIVDLDDQPAVAALIQDITDRKQAIQSLSDSERSLQFFRTLVNLTNDTIHVMDPATSRFLEINDLACERLGYTREELLQLGVIDIETELPDLAAWSQHVEEVKAAGSILLEGFHRRKDGTTFPVEINVRYVTVDRQEYLVAVVRDISERRQADAVRQLVVDDLRRSEERFSKLFHASPFSIIVASYPAGKILEVNDAFLNLFEFQRGDVIGKTTGELDIWVLPGDRQRMLDSVRTYGAARNMEYLFRTKNGNHLTLVMSVEIIQLDGQDYSLAMSVDITDRKAAEAELRKADELLRAVVESTTDAVFVKDRQGKYLLFNEAAGRFVGVPAEKVIGLDDTALFDSLTVKIVQDHDRRVLETGEVSTAEETLTAAGISRTYLSTKAPYRDEAGNVIGLIGISRDISERKQSEQVIRENEERLRLLMDSIPAYISYVDAEEKYRWVNQVYEDWYQIPREQILGRTVREMQGEDFYAVMQDQIQQALRGETVHYEQTLVTKEQLRKTFDTHYIPHRNAEGRVLGFFVVVFDLTAERTTQHALRESEERYRKLFETCGDAVFILDLQGQIRSANPTAAAMHGYSLDELIGKSIRELDVPVDAHLVSERMQRLQSGETLHFEVEHYRHDGTILPLDVVATLLTIGDEPLVLSFDRDITKRKETERALRLTQFSIDNAVDSVFWINSQGVILYVNDAVCRTLGYSREELIGRTVPEIDPNFPADAWPAHWEELQRRGSFTFESDHLTKDGRVLNTEVTVNYLQYEGQEYNCAVMRDITDRKRNEAQRQLLASQLAQAQKLEAIGRLAGGVAHDFNNILTVINGYSKLLQKMTPPEDERTEMLWEISDAGERAATLTQQLLNYSRKQVINRRVLDLNEVVREMEKMLRQLIGENIQLTIAYHDQPALVTADASQIGQVVMNLAVNARDAMPRGGVLTMALRIVNPEPELLQAHPGIQPGKFVQLSVTDTGSGIPATLFDRIFEPFFTTKGLGTGTGLGLASVRSIVEDGAGFVNVKSQLDHGTTFEVFLPAADTAATKSAINAPSSVHGQETILIVEDEDAVRTVMRRFLEQYGYRVLVAAGATEALRIASQHAETIDLLITDVIMPEISGRELVEKIQSTWPRMKYLYVSGYSTDDVVRHGVLQAQVDFLQKPFAPDVLADKVRAILDHGHPPSNPVRTSPVG